LGHYQVLTKKTSDGVINSVGEEIEEEEDQRKVNMLAREYCDKIKQDPPMDPLASRGY